MGRSEKSCSVRKQWGAQKKKNDKVRGHERITRKNTSAAMTIDCQSAP